MRKASRSYLPMVHPVNLTKKRCPKKTAQTNQTDITISIKRTTDSALSALQQQAVGSQPAWDIKLTSGGKNISDMGGVITLTHPMSCAPASSPMESWSIM